MNAMVFHSPDKPLVLQKVDIPKPASEQILIKVHTCGVCRTDLHILDGELTEAKKPLILGHEIIGTVVETGSRVNLFKKGDRIGVPWLGATCGKCYFCRNNKENLCDNALFTGYSIDGGFAEYTVAHQNYSFKIPKKYNDLEAAPLLCAGLIGYRSYSMIDENAHNLGLYGFGAAAHIISQIAIYNGQKIYAFTRPQDKKAIQFAYELGATWAGYSDEPAPAELDAAIIFAPVGALVPAALKTIKKGGCIICAGIHMSDIPSFSYDLLWGERIIRSVANLVRNDGIELMNIAPKVPVKTSVIPFPLSEANKALKFLRNGKINGAAVLKMT
ncbi:MAG: zinc-dependent alcohol dehydrogenase family protein [Chitinispirillia bacterium]